MGIISRLIEMSVRHRAFVLIGVLAFVAVGARSVDRMTFDAFPDLTNVQVQVLTASPGMAAEEVELLVTLPIERALNGTPGLSELRSLSRTGISSVTAVFDDGTDMYFARQLIKERLDAALAEVPPGAGTPEIAPPSTGLGEVYQFTFSSDSHSLAELSRIFERDVEPRLRSVQGVVEVNVWGGGAPQIDVKVDPFRSAALGVRLEDIETAIGDAIGLQSGGSQALGGEQLLLRAASNPRSLDEIGAIEVQSVGGTAVLLRDVARVVDGRSLTVGLGSADGRGEVLFVMVQLLAGADALEVAGAVDERVREIRSSLPEDVDLEGIYDRRKLVGSTLATVARSLIEGGILVVLVLLVLLGDLRAGLIVASVIPLSMLGAFTGLYLIGYSGNLMSLGAIDFGLVVDGTIVVVESIAGITVAAEGSFGEKVAERAQRVARPVMFAVSILLLVYLPIVVMQGTEGKLFRPMALTVLFALATALVLTFSYVPAISSLVIKPGRHKKTLVTRALLSAYEPVLNACLRVPVLAFGASVALLAGTVWVASSLGVEFVPRLEEGDMVVQTARIPSLNPEQALREATRVETVLREFPEVERVASRTGAPALATDPMGLEEADILVRLAPRDAWTTARTTEGLVEAISRRLLAAAPGAEFTFTQPIEMRFNELLEGITSDVGVKIYGTDHATLLQLGQQVAELLSGVDGAVDVIAPTTEGVPSLTLRTRPDRLALYNVSAEDVLATVGAVRRGIPAGEVTRGQFRDPVVVMVTPGPNVEIGDVPVVTRSGSSVPLSELGDIEVSRSAAIIERDTNSRRVIVESNVRGRDLGGFVVDAKRLIEEQVTLPDGYWIEWSGKFEQLRSATTRMMVMLPVVLFLIFGMLYLAFDSFRPALLIFLNVPIAASGGVLSLWLRGMPISMSAIVGAIALSGIAVMNGIVLLSRTRELHPEVGAGEAARRSALERFLPVLMTACVAGIGFLPMAIAHGVGAEVQRPLATVVIGGLVTCTPLTLLVLPALYARFFVEARANGNGQAA